MDRIESSWFYHLGKTYDKSMQKHGKKMLYKMNESRAKERIALLTKEIHKYDTFYYEKNEPLISDVEYDALRKELSALEREYPLYILPDSPNKRVGTPLKKTNTKTIKHMVPMLSIITAQNNEEVIDFDRTRKKTLGIDILEYVCEPKYDGLSCALYYEKGVLKTGATRGDGYEGEDVSNNAKVINGVPLNLKDGHPPELIEIRGEVTLFKKDFKKLNEQRMGMGKSLFANPRNAAAGSLRQSDAAVTASRKLHFLGWGIGVHKGWNPILQQDVLDQLVKWGFEVDPHRKVCTSTEQAISFYTEMGKIRERFPFEIDGVVIKIDRFDFQDKLGSTAHAPKWAIAYKFDAKQVTTTVRDIVVTIGRTGALTPVAELEPVKLGGVMISRASLHTFDVLQKRDIRIGDRVVLERAGDVIPEIIAPVTAQRSGREQRFKIPKKCPSCGTGLIRNGAYLVCKNTSCPAQLIARTAYLVSKQAFNIKGLGESSIQLMIEHGVIKEPSDIFYLTAGELTKLPKWGKKKAENLIREIDRRKRLTLAKFINSLSIQGVGMTVAKVLSKNLKTLDAILKSKKEDLIRIPTIGPNVADAFVSFFRDETHQKSVKKIMDAGVIIENV